MAAVLPIAMFAGSLIKSKFDSDAAQSQDAAMRAAGAAKLRAMREGAGQMEAYRQSLSPQMLLAMNNRMQAYAPAQGVLSQMYGGHQQAPMGQMMPRQPGLGPVAGGPTLLGQMGRPGPAINPGTPGGARAGSNPYFGEQFVPNVGFGGELPMPTGGLLRRKA